MLVRSPIIRDDVVFLADVMQVAVGACTDSNLLVRTRAAWALGE